MKICLQNLWKEEDGVLAFEWTLLVTLLTIGIVTGLAAARDAIIDELGDAAQSMLALDHSYSIDYPLEIAIDPNGNNPQVIGIASDSSFMDAFVYTDCDRAAAPLGQPGVTDLDS